MLAKLFIDRLEGLGLLDSEIIEALREQLEQGGSRVTPEAVAKLLVDNGQLTHFQATKLIGEIRSGQYEDKNEDASVASLDELTIAVDDDEQEQAEPASVARPASGAEAASAAEAIPVVVPVAPVEPAPLADLTAAPVEPRNRPQQPRRRPDPQESVWDSFKVYGYALIIALLVLGGGGLFFLLSRGNADEFITAANRLYDQQNYQGAQDMYLSFLDKFGDENQYSSVARTRVTMTELYKASQFTQEPGQAVELAKEKLPLIEEEPGINEERGNLAALLVDIAANVASAAGRADQTPEKRMLLAKLDEQLELMNNPIYMPTSMKAALASQLQAVEESRARVERDINRNLRLDESEAEMKSQLDVQDTKAAYQTRKDVLREFPELHDHERLNVLVRRASEIQQSLVKPTSKLPKTSDDREAEQTIKSIVLRTHEGRDAPSLRGETVFFRAGGSILAFDGENGEFKWRKYVGSATDLPPIRLDDGAGVLLSESESMSILRCDSEDGRVRWRLPIDEPFSAPVTVRDSIYVSGASGRLISLDAVSGDARWATQFPQPLETGPGVNDRARRGYIPGNHSNLYLLDMSNGSCLESFYIGHDEGTISIPPIPLLGHVFVIENAGTDYAKVHVLRVDETGEGLHAVQPPIRLTGNVRVDPVIQGRRLIVLTDRGEVTLLDIEPTAEREQVTVAASLPAFYDRPTATQMAVGRTQMWITGTRIGRYELQINTGNVVRDWSRYEGDRFIGKPFATDDAMIHARVMRGTSAIRVTAADPKTGEEIWHTDVGAPIAMLRQSSGGLRVVTTQAALFDLDREALKTGATKSPIENPGGAQVGIRFEKPINVDNARAVMIDQVDGQTMAVYDATRSNQMLRLMAMRISSGRPSGGSVAAGGGIVVPIDNGRVVLIDYRTGASMATPFQPASDPAGTVRWTVPVALADDPDQVVLGDSRKKIYRLRISDQIRELSSRDLAYELVGPAAGVGDTFVAKTAGPGADFLVGFEMANLDEKFKQLLPGRVVWGPISAGEICLLQTDDAQLRGFDAQGTERFAIQLPEGSPVGEPVQVDGLLILALSNGWLVRIDPTSGQIVAQRNLDQPISATPFPIGGKFLVPGVEGVVYIVDLPDN